MAIGKHNGRAILLTMPKHQQWWRPFAWSHLMSDNMRARPMMVFSGRMVPPKNGPIIMITANVPARYLRKKSCVQPPKLLLGPHLSKTG